MTTVASLVDRVRMELGDTAKSFVYSFDPDGYTNRYTIPFSPVDGPLLVVKQGNTDLSNLVEVEEHTGVLTFDTPPNAGHPVIVSGVHYRYFTTSEVENLIDNAVLEHTHRAEDPYGRKITLANLPAVEEYPVALLASTFGLFTLATDAAFDIDIVAPDGVNIPRSERYRQLMEVIQLRQAQYQELCEKMGIGLYRIEVFTVRRISQTTNRMPPIYKPQEVDDRSRAQRVRLQVPNYGGTEFPTTVQNYDFNMYAGDSFECILDFPFALTDYTVFSQIRDYVGSPAVLQNFTLTVLDEAAGTVKFSLTSSQTKTLPEISYWDVRLKSTTDPNYEQTYLQGKVFCKSSISEFSPDPYSYGWRG